MRPEKRQAPSALLGVTMVGGALLARVHVRRSRTAARAMAELVDGSQ